MSDLPSASGPRLIGGRLIQTLAAWSLVGGGELRLRTVDGVVDLRRFELLPGNVQSVTRDGVTIPADLAGPLAAALRELADG